MRGYLFLILAYATEACSLDTASPAELGMVERESAPVPTDAGAGGDSAIDETAILSSIANGAYRTSPDFTHAVRAPYASVAAAGSTIDEWVSTIAWPTYAGISPDDTGAAGPLPVGTIVVRAIVDANGNPTKLTLMSKGPAGYNPALGDGWFGETDPSGAPLESDAGVLTGRMTGCYSCHIPRESEGYVFGIPAADRAL